MSSVWTAQGDWVFPLSPLTCPFNLALGLAVLMAARRVPVTSATGGCHGVLGKGQCQFPQGSLQGDLSQDPSTRLPTPATGQGRAPCCP